MNSRNASNAGTTPIVRDLPQYVIYAITNRCNSRCSKCTVWRMNADGPELPASRWNEISHELADWLGPMEVILSGGEPTLRADCNEIVRSAAALGHTVTINSNGLNLSPDIARALADTGLFGVNLSLDGPRGVNDAVKGIGGATWRLWDGVETLKIHRPDIEITITVILMRQNIAVLPDFVGSLIRDGRVRVRFQAVVQPLGEPDNPDWFRESDLWPDDPDAVWRAMDWVIAQKNAGAPIDNPVLQLEAIRRYMLNPLDISNVPCSMGRRWMIILEEGSLRFCPFMPPVGNAAQGSVRAIVESAAANRLRDRISECTRLCHALINCYFAEDL